MATTDISALTGANAAENNQAVQHYNRKDVSPNKEMTMDDFFTLLAAQLRYQDMSSPMSNSEMMSQLTQMANISSVSSLTDSLGKVATTIEEAMNSMSQISLSTYATNLLGQTVTVADLDETGQMIGTTTGVVEGVSLTGSDPYIYVNGKNYLLSHLISTGVTPDNKTDGSDTDTDTDVDGGEDKVEGGESVEGEGDSTQS